MFRRNTESNVKTANLAVLYWLVLAGDEPPRGAARARAPRPARGRGMRAGSYISESEHLRCGSGGQGARPANWRIRFRLPGSYRALLDLGRRARGGRLAPAGTSGLGRGRSVVRRPIVIHPSGHVQPSFPTGGRLVPFPSAAQLEITHALAVSAVQEYVHANLNYRRQDRSIDRTRIISIPIWRVAAGSEHVEIAITRKRGTADGPVEETSSRLASMPRDRQQQQQQQQHMAAFISSVVPRTVRRQYMFGLYASIDAYKTCVRLSTVPPGQPDDKRYITGALSRYTYVDCRPDHPA